MIVVGKHAADAAASGSNPYPGSPLIGWGIVFIAASVLVPIFCGILSAISHGIDARERWLEQFPPEQRERIRKAQNYAMGVAALGAVDVGLRAANKRTSANTAAMQAAKQRRRAEAEGQQRHRELLDAIRQGGHGQGPQGLQPQRWIPPGTQ